MRILLDENLPSEFWRKFPDFECQSALFAGFAGLKNGALLSAAIEANFEVLLTMDKSIPAQNDLRGKPIAVIVLRPRIPGVNALGELLPMATRTLQSIQPGEVRVISYLDIEK